MAALVTLTVAARHIRATWTVGASPADDRDADLQLKVNQASDIILSYLKGRRIQIDTLTSSGGVATATARNLHGLTTNDLISSFGWGEPEYNGSFTATVTSTTTFTFPVTGTPAATATGIGSITAVQTWTDATVPARVQAAVLLMVTHLYEKRGDDPETDAALWEAIGRLLVRDRDPALA